MKGILERRQYGSDFELWCRCYRDVKFLAHYHTDVEMILVRGGAPRITVNNHTYPCKKGDVIIVRPGDIHFNEHDNSENVLDFVVFNPIILGDIYSSQIELIPHVAADLAEEYGFSVGGESLFDMIHRELCDKQRYYDAAIKSRLRSFWVDYLRHFTTGEQGGLLVSPNRLSRIRVLLDYIDRHYDQDIPLAKAAELLGYDTFHCSKTFKAITGVNFVTYLNTVRVGKALEMLRSSGGSMIDIALDCGFNTPRTFNRVFKEIAGMTPTEYLKTLEQGIIKPSDDPAQNHTILSFSDSWL